MIEIERKFLVDMSKMTPFINRNEIKQGYLSIDPERTVRIRVQEQRGYITVKGKSSEDGLSRFEWEEYIDKDDAIEMMKMCINVIEKTRYLVVYGNHYWEVDVFHGENEGLVIAEIELSSVDERFMKPPFISYEVTGETNYYNSALATNPYSKWPEGLK